jgi:hypothetical protein
MKLSALAIGAVAAAAGVVGGLSAYANASGDAPAPPAPVSMHHPVRPQPVRPGVILKWAPCQKPAVREGRACVTHVTRTVVLPAPAVPAAPAPAPAPVPHHAPPPHEKPTHEPADPPGDDSEPGDDGGNDGPGDDGPGDD